MLSPMALRSLDAAGSFIEPKAAMMVSVAPTPTAASSFLQLVSALHAAIGASVVNCSTVSDVGAAGSSFTGLVSLDAAWLAVGAALLPAGGASVVFSSHAVTVPHASNVTTSQFFIVILLGHVLRREASLPPPGRAAVPSSTAMAFR